MNIFNPVVALPFLYLDPGSGSFIIQLLIAMAVGIGVTARLYWAKIKSMFTGKKEPAKPTADDDLDEE